VALLGHMPENDSAVTAQWDKGNEEEFAPDVVVAAEFGALVTPEHLTTIRIMKCICASVCCGTACVI
jgi:hypothetical protein